MNLPKLRNVTSDCACLGWKSAQFCAAIITTALALSSTSHAQCLHSTQTAKLEPADAQKGDNLGQSVAISGSTLICGANDVDTTGGADAGAAYIYELSLGAWTQQAKLVALDGATDDSFGISVAIDGDTAVVGASFARIGTQASQGAVYIFVRSGGAWTQQAKLVGLDSDANDRFGRSVAIRENTVAIGSTKGVYVFVRSGTAWVQSRAIAVSAGNFGYAVSLSDDQLMVGAPNEVVGGFTAAGAAYIYQRTGSDLGPWNLQSRLTPSVQNTSMNFGKSVSIDGVWAVVGAPGYMNGTTPNAGAAYFYRRQGPTWIAMQQLKGSASPAGNFGGAVSIYNQTAAIGSVGYQQLGYPLSGTGAIFKLINGTWVNRAMAWVSDPRPSARLGTSIAIFEQTAVIGATGGGSNPLTSNAGAVYIFDFTACCPTDFNVDSVIEDADFVIFATSYEVYNCADPEMPIGCAADLNHDEQVDDLDFAIFATAYERYICP